MEKEKTFDIIIIGSGPAGLTAGIYSARAGYKTLIFEGTTPGGQLIITPEVENFPGFPDGISGFELIEKIKNQTKKFGAEFIMEEITKVNFKTYPFKLYTSNDEYIAKSVIIATGATAKYLDIPAIHKLKGKGVSACATCDGFFFKDKIVYVIGGGDTAAEEALFLTKFAKKVFVVHRRDKLRAEQYFQNKLFQHPKIEIIWNTVVEDVKDVEKGKVEKIILKNVKTNEITEHNADGIFMAVGHTPATQIFKDEIKLDEKGYIITDKECRTNIEGIFAAGDVQAPKFRQAIVAAGDGAIAAISADKFLQSKT